MTRLLTAIVALLGVITIYGFIRGDGKDRMRVSALNERNIVTVIITVPDADDRYYWLKVFGCSADVTENGVRCNGYWDAVSEREPGAMKQHLIPFRDCPRNGSVRFDAIVFDRFGNVLASGQHTILRAF